VLAHERSVRASVRAPSRTAYVADALGIGGVMVEVQLTNTGSRPVAVDRFRVAFTATREGVRFPCKEHIGGAMSQREPASLAPGRSFVFQRDLDCSMPLPGHYDVDVYVAFGDRADSEPSDLAGSFSLDVAEAKNAPQPYPSRPGLYVAMTGPRATQPLTEVAWARGDYHVVVGLVNGTNQPVPLGAGKIAFLTYRQGSPLPCAGQATQVALPDELAPGAIHLVSAPVTCAPSSEGRYEIVGKLTLGKDVEGVEIGRARINVRRDPLLFDPDPRPFQDRYPEQHWTR
jgi:hypothetical protein